MGDEWPHCVAFSLQRCAQRTSRLAVANWVEKFHQHRLTPDFSVLNNARKLCFWWLARQSQSTGEIFGEKRAARPLPGAEGQAASGAHVVVLDRAAAQGL